LFGGKKLTEDDCLGDALIVFSWTVGARHHTYSSKVPYEELARVAEQYCDPAVPCNCKAGALIEVPAEMAQRLLQIDAPRRSAIAAAKAAEDLAATVFQCGPSKPLKVMAVTPLHLLRFSSVRDGYAEVQLPAQQRLRCVYLGQPEDDGGGFAHASLDWSSSEWRISRTKVSYEWRVQRGERPIITRTVLPLRYDAFKIPEHYLLAKKLLEVFEGICHRSLTRLGKYRPPCTVVTCRLLGSPKHGAVGPEDLRTFRQDDGTTAEHLMAAHVKGDLYVCCANGGAWEAARKGRLSFNHFVLRDLAIDARYSDAKARHPHSKAQPLMSLIEGDPEATSAILAVGSLMASCARMTVGGWAVQITVDTDAFEHDPWFWSCAAQSARPLVWALWTTSPVGGGWQGKTKRFLSAALVKDVLERRHFPIPNALKTSPLAPLESYWHPLATSSELWRGLHNSFILQLNPYNYVLNPPNELQQWVRQRGLDVMSASRPPEGAVTIMPMDDCLGGQPGQSQPSKVSPLNPGAFGDADQSTGSDTSSESEAEIGRPIGTHPETDSLNVHAHVVRIADDESSEEEDVCYDEDPGMHYVESPQQERDRLFGAIEDMEEREKQYRDWCVSNDQIELGYG